MTQAFGSNGFEAQAATAGKVLGDAGLREDWSTALLSALLIVGVPVAFWMGLMEVAAAASGWSYGFHERLLVGGALAAFLFIIRGCARIASRS